MLTSMYHTLHTRMRSGDLTLAVSTNSESRARPFGWRHGTDVVHQYSTPSTSDTQAKIEFTCTWKLKPPFKTPTFCFKFQISLVYMDWLLDRFREWNNKGWGFFSRPPRIFFFSRFRACSVYWTDNVIQMSIISTLSAFYPRQLYEI
jgi:hypothetical protein